MQFSQSWRVSLSSAALPPRTSVCGQIALSNTPIAFALLGLLGANFRSGRTRSFARMKTEQTKHRCSPTPRAAGRQCARAVGSNLLMNRASPTPRTISPRLGRSEQCASTASAWPTWQKRALLRSTSNEKFLPAMNSATTPQLPLDMQVGFALAALAAALCKQPGVNGQMGSVSV
jgi:hypothetical protein